MTIGRVDIWKDGKKTRFKSADGYTGRLGKKVFGLVLPPEYEAKLNLMSQKQRIGLMRQAVMKAIDELGEKV